MLLAVLLLCKQDCTHALPDTYCHTAADVLQWHDVVGYFFMDAADVLKSDKQFVIEVVKIYGKLLRNKNMYNIS